MIINTQLTTQLIQSQFPQWAHLAIEPVSPGGWDHRTFRLGEEMVVRLPSAKAYASQIEKEQYWLPRLALKLPVKIPTPIAQGKPGEGYPFSFSIYQWIDGKPVTQSDNLPEIAKELAAFLKSLQSIEASGGPPPGEHNFFRGGALHIYDKQTREAIKILDGQIDREKAVKMWEDALESKWDHRPVWVHGDMASGNLLTLQGKLEAVIDFGCLAVGDPACDLAIAWTLFDGENRRLFLDDLGLDQDTQKRALGWTLWKSLMTVSGLSKAYSESQLFYRDVLRNLKISLS